MTTLAMAKMRPQRSCTALCALSYVRKVNADPRITMPMSSSVKGMWRTIARRAKAGGKQLKSRTTTMISQTWLASQIGTDRVRDQIPLCLAPRAGRQQVPDTAAEIRAREQRVGHERDDDDAGDHDRERRGILGAHAASPVSTCGSVIPGLLSTCW